MFACSAKPTVVRLLMLGLASVTRVVMSRKRPRICDHHKAGPSHLRALGQRRPAQDCETTCCPAGFGVPTAPETCPVCS